MAACAANLPPEGDELDFAGLTPLPSKRVDVPGIAEAPIRFECKLFEMRATSPRRNLCIAEVLALSAQEGIFDPETHYLDLSAYRPIGRLCGDSCAELSESFEVPIPPAPKEAS